MPRPTPQEQLEAIPVSHRPFRARGAAYRLWTCRDEEILIEGPAGTGKSRTLLEKLYFCALKYRGMRGLIVRKTRESLSQTVLVTFEEKVIPPGSPILDGPSRNLRQSYKFPNGSEIVLGGMDKPTKVMSAEYDLICCFETTEFTEEDFENLTTRLRNGVMPYQQIIADCNPSSPQHWLNQRASSSKMTRLRSRHTDNPMLYDDDGKPTPMGKKYVEKLSRLSGHRRMRLLEGKWAAAEGLVYEDFDHQVHVVDPFKIPPHWRRIRTIDFGYTNPFVCQWWAIGPDNEMYLYREIYFSRRIVADHAVVINRWSQGERYEATLADWDAEDRATLERGIIFTTPAFKDIAPGIQAIMDRLRKEDNGRPRIFFFSDALIEVDEELKEQGLPTSTVQEFDGYAYPKKPEKDDKGMKEDPIDKDNHGMDAMRYAVAYVDNLQGMNLKIEADTALVVERD